MTDAEKQIEKIKNSRAEKVHKLSQFELRAENIREAIELDDNEIDRWEGFGDE